jgi:hypothetical protein
MAWGTMALQKRRVHQTGRARMDHQMERVLLGMGALASLTGWAHRAHPMAEEAQARQMELGLPVHLMVQGTMDCQMGQAVLARRTEMEVRAYQTVQGKPGRQMELEMRGRRKGLGKLGRQMELGTTDHQSASGTMVRQLALGMMARQLA